MNIQEAKMARKKFLLALFKETKGNEYNPVNMWGLGEKLGLDREETGKICDYLVNESLVGHFGMGGSIRITHEGIKHSEKILSRIKKGNKKQSKSLGDTTIYNIKNMHGSQIQHGNKGNNMHQKKVDHYNLKGSKREENEDGIRAGILSLIISFVLWVLGLNAGWNLSGQVILSLAITLTILGGLSIKNPQKYGRATGKILRNIREAIERD